MLLVGGIFGLNADRVHWKHVAETRQVEVIHLQDQINTMTSTQDTQTKTSTQTVTKVIQLPGTVSTVIKQVDVPVPSDCSTPNYPQTVKDSF